MCGDVFYNKIFYDDNCRPMWLEIERKFMENDSHKLHTASILNGKYANWNFQYGRYSRNDVMKRGLCVSCLHDYYADPKNIILEVCKEPQNRCILTKVRWSLRRQLYSCVRNLCIFTHTHKHGICHDFLN